MFRSFLITLIFSFLMLPTFALAWNLDAMHVSAVDYGSDGTVRFTLRPDPAVNADFMCTASSQWFIINRCAPNDMLCHAGVNRMSSLLLAAKLGNRPVHVFRSNCSVSSVVMR